MTKKNKHVFGSLEEEVQYLRKQVAGLKGHNGILTGKLRDAERAAKHNREVDVEGDVLYEQRLAEIDGLKTILCGKDKTIEGLESQVTDFSTKIDASCNRIQKLIAEKKALEDKIEHHNELPWIMRIFKKV